MSKMFAELDVVSFPEAGEALQYAKRTMFPCYRLVGLR